MDKRYQVFVSSTFVDLKKERQKVIQTLMEMDCIPSGMELFPATDEEQLSFIKRIIDDCDYYLLVIGGRYGSVDKEGVSYTEREYDYAVEKGIKVIAFIHGRPEQLKVCKTDDDLDKRCKLTLFADKVKESRVVKFWSSTEELPGLVATSLLRMAKVYPARGWVRGEDISSGGVLREQLGNLRSAYDDAVAENEVLSSKNEVLSARVEALSSEVEEFNRHGDEGGSYAGGQDKVNIELKYSLKPDLSVLSLSMKCSWSEILWLAGAELITPVVEEDVGKVIGFHLLEYFEGMSRASIDFVELDKWCLRKIKVQWVALGYVKVFVEEGCLGWRLTDAGEREMCEIAAIPRTASYRLYLPPEEGCDDGEPKSESVQAPLG